MPETSSSGPFHGSVSRVAQGTRSITLGRFAVSHVLKTGKQATIPTMGAAGETCFYVVLARLFYLPGFEHDSSELAVGQTNGTILG